MKRERQSSRASRTVTAALAAVLLGGGIAAAAVTDPFGTTKVGQRHGDAIQLPSNQTVSPIGKRHLTEGGKLLSSTLSPDGRFVASLTAGGGIALTISDLTSGTVVQQAGKSADADVHMDSNSVGQEGPAYSPDGRTLWVPQVNGLDRFPVKSDGTLAPPTFVSLPKDGSKSAVPAGMTFSDDGSKLYVALNGQNALGVLDPKTGKLLSTYPVGNAPRQVAVVGDRGYVSNEGGRPATGSDFALDSYGTGIVADPETGASTTGTVSVVNLTDGHADAVDVGLHPTDLYRHGNLLFVTNTGGDSVSILDTRTSEVLQTFATDPLPGATVGYHPNAVTMPDDHHVLVSLGRANALALYELDEPRAPVSYKGLLPTDYYPAGVVTDHRRDNTIVVTNERGIGSRGPSRTIDAGPGTTPATGSNTHQVTGSLTTFALPRASQMKRYTRQVFRNNGWDREPHPGKRASAAPPKPVPDRLGGRSPIQHVFLIDKENRSYDQVFGDVRRGDGDPSLAQFGAQVTPNAHALVDDYTLFDNAYDIGTNSAEGHNWLMQGDDNEYVESQFGEYERSYGSNADALGHQRDGFLWNAAEAAGRTTRVFGEYNPSFKATDPERTGFPSWSQWYCDSQVLEAKASGPLPVPTDAYQTSSPIPSLRRITDPDYPPFNLQVPDQYRVDIWLRSFKEAERTGQLPNLNLMWLPSDHTAGVKKGQPYPRAMVADNDLALGRIVDAISHSRFWKNSAIFVIEDDTQNGVDHVDGHRGPMQIISPYAVRGKVDSRYYTQLNLVRTIEQILGMRPMNQKDQAATPMRAAFKSKPDLTPYNAQPARVPLTEGLDPAPKCGSGPSTAARAATPGATRATVPARARDVRRVWVRWSGRQRFGGTDAKADYANPAQMDRLIWYQSHGWRMPYPGDRRILAPGEVAGGAGHDTDG